jgi:hypothetical protein
VSSATAPTILDTLPKSYWTSDEKNWALIQLLHKKTRDSDFYKSIWRFLEAKGYLTKDQQAAVTSTKRRGRPPVPNKFCHEKKTLPVFTFTPSVGKALPPVEPVIFPPRGPTPPPVPLAPVEEVVAKAMDTTVSEIRAKFEALKTGAGVSGATAVPEKSVPHSSPPLPPPKPVNPFEGLRKMLLHQRGYTGTSPAPEEQKEKV